VSVTSDGKKLRQAAKGQSCVACSAQDGTVVLAHYTGVRRLAFGGGFGRKVHDIVAAHLCARCHRLMDTQNRDKAKRWEHSEAFLNYCMLTIIRLWEQGVIGVK
jgi:formate-dependent nitrite reductase cytochrome c552 subunit